MTFENDAPQNRVADRIIRSRGETPTGGENNAPAYQAAIISDGFPHMGFSVFCKNGKRHGFLYHNLENLDLTDGKRESYLCFTHRGKAATVYGSNLHEMFQAIMEHTLQAAYEYDAEAYPSAPEGEAVITRIRIDDLNLKPKEKGEADKE